MIEKTLEESRAQEEVAAVAREGKGRSGVTGPSEVNLAEVTEATRRALYEAVVAVHFSPSLDEVREARRHHEWYQRFSPDECRLTVLHLAGRWFACWRIWDAGEGVPEDQEWSLVRVVRNLSRPYGVEFFEV